MSNLDPPEEVSYISLISITAARRGLPITIHGTPASTTRSSKRSRRISSISHADPDDSDAEYGTDSPTKTYPLKRARISLGAAASRKGEHPSHKMTKAEVGVDAILMLDRYLIRSP